MRAKRNYEEPAKRGEDGEKNTFPLAQFNPGAAREDGASEIERINAKERRFRSGTTAT